MCVTLTSNIKKRKKNPFLFVYFFGKFILMLNKTKGHAQIVAMKTHSKNKSYKICIFILFSINLNHNQTYKL